MNPRQVKRFHRIAFWFWVVPGLPISIYLRDSVAWVMVLSIYTILIEHALGWRQEKREDEARPNEEDDP